MSSLPNISPDLIKAYQEQIAASGSPATLKRKSISLNRFFDWAEAEGHLSENPFREISNGKSQIANVSQTPNKSENKNKTNGKTRTWATIGLTTALVIVVFLLAWKLKFPIQFIQNFAKENTAETVQQSAQATNVISATPAANLAWNLYTKLKLTDSDGVPQIGSQTINFKLYNSQTNGTPIYTSEPTTITTDTNGSALISLDGVPSDLFFGNNQLFLEPQIGSSSGSMRIPVSTANIAANLGGYLPANPEVGANTEEIPVISSDGSLLLASQSPAIKATTGNLLVEGQTVTIKSADGGGGNIEINPDANGYLHFLFEGNKGNFVNAQAPNLKSGSLYYGMVPNNSTGYYLINLQNGSKLKTKFSVDAIGNTNMTGNLATNGVDRLTNTGALQNITGYSQTSGNLTVTQGAGDFVSINKTLTTGEALNDVMTLTLDERGKPSTSDSDYSTLVLNRYDGNGAGAALKVNTGNAIFNGQVQLGRYTANPLAIGAGGSIVYNSGDGKIYLWNGSAWVALGTGTSSFSGSFADLTSGTNTSATMVVGTGSSLGFTGTGTINASSLEGKTWETPGTIGSTTPNTGIFTTVNATSGLYTGAGTGTQRVDSSGNLVNIGNISGTGAITVTPASGSNLNVALSTTGDFAVNTNQLYVDTSEGNVGIGITNPHQSLTVAGNLTSAISSGYFSTGNMLLAQLEGGSFFGGTKITENQWALNNFGTTWVNKGNDGTLRDVAVSSDGKIILVAADNWYGAGPLTISNNYGNTWASTGSPSVNWRSVAVSSDGKVQTGVAYGNYIYVSYDYGASWAQKGTSLNWDGIAMSSDGKVQTATAYGNYIYVSYDYGATWTAKDSSRNWNGIAMSSDGKVQTAGVASDHVYVSSDYGATWASKGSFTSASDIAMSSDGKIQTAVVPGGYIFISSDYGVNWTQKGISETWSDVAISSDGKIQTAVIDSTYDINDGIYVSSDYGANWIQKKVDEKPWRAVAMSSDGKTQAAVLFDAGGVYLSFADSYITGGNVGIGTISPTAMLDVAGNASISGTLAFRAGTGTIQSTAFNPLVLGGNTTGNITLNPSNAIAGGFIGPGVTNVTDLGTAFLLFRNVYGTTLYQGTNQVCDTSGNCTAATDVWSVANGTYIQKYPTADLLLGGSATSSAKFAFTGVNSGTPTASISGSIAGVSTYLTGNGILATTNMQNLTLGNTTTGNVVLNPNGGVGIATVPVSIDQTTVSVKDASLPTGRQGLSCAEDTSTNKIYCFGGDNYSSFLNQIVEYDPTSDTVTPMSGTLSNSGYSSCTEDSSTNQIYCFGGYNNFSLSSQIIKYDPATDTVTWSGVNLPSSEGYLSCAEDSSTNQIYCFGGYTGTIFQSQILKYNPTTDTITTMGVTLPSGISNLSCSEDSSTHQIYCFGGNNGFGEVSQIIKYDPIADTVTVMGATLPTPSSALSCTEDSSTHQIYCFGGVYSNRIIKYDPTTDTTSTVSSTLPSNLAAHSCAEDSSTHQIYCFGGNLNNGNGILSQIVQFNPSTSVQNKLEVAGTVQLRGAAGLMGLSVDSNGNVGIGTTSPMAKLDINGKVVTTGSELITNGTFTGDSSGWTLERGAVYGNDQVTITDSGDLYTSINVKSGKTYLLTFTLSNVVNDTVFYYFDNISASASDYGNGTHTVAFSSNYTGTDNFYFSSGSGNTGSTWTIDNISLKESSDIAPALRVTAYDGSVALSLGGDLLRNTALGVSSFASNISGIGNSALGDHALNSNMYGSYNNALGSNALALNTYGNNNNAMGTDSLYSNIYGNYNNAMGTYSLYSNITGSSNTAIGDGTLGSNTTGSNNTAIGVNTLANNSTGYENTAIGEAALGNLSPTSGTITAFTDYSSTVPGTVEITSVGHGLPTGDTTNISISGYNNYSPSVYTATYIDADHFYIYANYSIGNNTGWWSKDTEGRYNTALGTLSGVNLTTGSNNSSLGYASGTYISDGVSRNQTSNNSLYLGANTKALADGDTNEIVIGDSAIGAGSNSVVLGNDSITSTLLKGDIYLTGALNVNADPGSPGQVLTSTGTGLAWSDPTTGSSLWQETSGSLAPLNITDSLNLGSTATSSALIHLAGTVGENSWINTGNLGIGTTAPDKALEINSATGDNLRLTYNDSNGSAANYTDFTMSSTGDLIITPTGGQVILPDGVTINIGGLANVAYNSLANTAEAPLSTAITADNDLLVTGDVEIKGGLYLSSERNIYNTTAGGVSTGTITFPADPTAVNSYNSLVNGSWLVQNSVNNGIAALMVNQAKGGDIFTASASGVTKFVINNAGNVGIGTTVPGSRLDVVGTSSLATVGVTSLLTPDGGFDSSTNWTEGTGWTIGSSVATHATGNTDALSGTSTATSTSTVYQVKFTVAVTTPGDGFTLSLGGGTNGITYSSAGSYTTYIRPTGTSGTLSFTPGANGTFVGTVDTVSIYALTASTPELTLRNSDGTATNLELRAGGSGKFNTFIGTDAGKFTTSAWNTATGYQALYSNTTSRYNTAYGFQTLYNNTTGESNTATGYQALYSNTTGGSNASYGNSSLKSNTTGYDNTATGYLALYNNTTGYDNTATGYATLYGNTTGYRNTAIGISAGFTISDGNNNTFIGYNAGNNASQLASAVNSTAIGNGAYTTASNQIVIGNTAVTQTLLRGNIGIGTTVPESKLQVTGGGLCVGSDTDCNTDNNTEGVVYSSSTSMTAYDVAENYPTRDPDLTYGEIAELDPDSGVFVKRASSQYSNKLLGVVSEKPAVLLGGFNGQQYKNERQVSIALSGRVPVKIDPASPEIKIGDSLTASSMSGTAQKTTQAGFSIGKALEDWSPGMGKSSILVFVSTAYIDPNIYLTDAGNLNIAQVSNGTYQLTNNKTIIDKIGAFGQMVAANIKAGAIATGELVTNKLTATVATVQQLTANNLAVKLISPIPGEDLAVQLTQDSKFKIEDSNGVEVASIDASGSAAFNNATISGTLYADDIKSKSLDNIQALLTEVKIDQDVLKNTIDWNTLNSTSSANLSELAVTDLYVTNQAAINSLSVTNSLALGSDLVFNGIDSSLNTLSSPLRLQSLAMAPVEIMSGLVTIDTKGNVNIAGDLFVAGKIKSSGLTLKDSQQLDSSTVQQSSSSSALLSLQDINGNLVSSVNASGSAQFNLISTPQLVIANAEATTSGTIVNGEITTNSTIGKASIPAGATDITIKNNKVTDFTMIYVTPTSSTQNNVLYVKSKENGKFVVGFTNPIDTDVSFNWWIVQVQ